MNNRKFSIKSLEELYKIAISSEDIENYIKVVISETEEKIIKALQSNQAQVVINIGSQDYNLVAFGNDLAYKIIAYNLVLSLSEKKYAFSVKRAKNNIYILINLSDKSGMELNKMLDTYLQSFEK